VARRLTARGHEVFTPTLTGLAERSHLLGGDIDLDTQILDVVNVMKWQGLKDIVLVGHSYGGMVVSRVAEKMEKTIASFVMLDAFFPEDGQSLTTGWRPREPRAGCVYEVACGHDVMVDMPDRLTEILDELA
jgi:pimeloyl-ACP methyl ester carboxylesterase